MPVEQVAGPQLGIRPLRPAEADAAAGEVAPAMLDAALGLAAGRPDDDPAGALLGHEDPLVKRGFQIDLPGRLAQARAQMQVLRFEGGEPRVGDRGVER